MSNLLIDTHTHIADPEFDKDREEVIERALAAGIYRMILIGTSLPSSQRAVALAEKYPFLWAAIGLHPHDAKDLNDDLLNVFEQLADHPKVVAIGETGLDYFYNHSPTEVQKGAFIEQIRLAKRKQLPLVVHTRDAWKDTFDLLKNEDVREYAESIGAVFHCFTGDKAVAEEGIGFGFHISFSGIVTFPKATPVQEAAACIPLEKILIETDAPYLAPQGKRGKRNEPAFVSATAEKLAQLRNCPLADISKATRDNANRLFKLPGSE
ncbi:MAG: TatD family hydrolase [Nitrospiria bacterium]